MSNVFLESRFEFSVPFFDVDSMNIVWHGHYVKYFELARCQLLELFDFGYVEMSKSDFSWPVVDVRVKYVKPLVFEQKVVVVAQLVEFENRLKFNYEVLDAASGVVHTKGFSIQVAVARDSGELCFVSPDVLLDRLRKVGVS